MPLSGEPWDPRCAEGGELHAPFRALTRRLAGPSWPHLELYTTLGEERRRAIAPGLTPLTFCAAPKKSRRHKRESLDLAELYDGSIHLRGSVPCLEESYHDLWNAVIFAAFPRAKRALHARQFHALQRAIEPGSTRLPGRRSRERDALTVFDEGGSVVLLSPASADAWRAGRPIALTSAGPTEGANVSPWQSDEDERSARLIVFGHALLEHWAKRPTAVRSSGLVFVSERWPNGPELLDVIDLLVAERLSDPREFGEPGADAVVELTVDAQPRLCPPRESTKDFSCKAESEIS